MKKTLFLLGFAALFAQSTQAQHVKFGVEAGVNMNKMKFDASGLSGIGLTNGSVIGAKAGLLADIGAGPISIQPGIFYSMKGGKQSINFLGSIENRTTVNYIEVPVWVLYKHKLGPGKIFGGVAPSVAYAINGKSKATTNILGVVEEFKDDVEFGSDSTDMKRLDYAANFGVGYELSLGLFVRFSYNLGLANLSNDPAFDTKNRTFAVSVGWLFGK